MNQIISKSSQKSLESLAADLGTDLEKWSKEEGYGLNSEGEWDAPVCPFITNEKGEVIIINLREQKLTAIPASLNWKNFKKIQAIDLGSNNLTELDLNIFSGMKELRKLYLSNNSLTEVDLSPLSSLSNLQELFLSRNLIKYVDLSPLGSLKKLTTIGLSENEFDKIDLTALADMNQLEDLRLDFVKLKTIDLAPLASLSNLAVLWLNNNNLTNINLIPLLEIQMLKGGIHSGGVNLTNNKLDEETISQINQLRDQGIDVHH